MPDQELINYVSQCKQSGMADDQIRQALLSAGWNIADVNAALTPRTPPAPAVPTTPTSASFPRTSSMTPISGASPAIHSIAPGQDSYEAPTETMPESLVPIPKPVKVIAVLGYLGSALFIILGLLGLVGGVLFSALKDSLSKVPVLGALAQIGGLMFIILGIGLLGGAVLLICVSRGLWKGKNWARIFVAVALSSNALWGIITIIRSGKFNGIVGIVVSAAIVAYLLLGKKVKAAFSTAAAVARQTKALTISFVSLVVLIGAVSGGSWWVGKNAGENIQNQVQSLQASSTSTGQIQTQSNPDVDRVKVILEDIRQGYLTNNNDLVLKHASAQTVGFLSTAKLQSAKSFTINAVSQDGTNIIANVTTVSAEANSDTQTQEMVFIKEGGDWKFDLGATMQRAMGQMNAEKGTGDPNGLPDFVVMSAVVYPTHPIVNSKDVQITVTIKNIGTKTADNGVSLFANLVEFADEIPYQYSDLSPITPGETVAWKFKPYEKNDFFKISDTPGNKTIQIVLNKDRKVIESNYDNNVFTQLVEMYAQ